MCLKAFKIKPFRNETKLKQARTIGNDDENDNDNNSTSTSNISNKKMALFSFHSKWFYRLFIWILHEFFRNSTE